MIDLISRSIAALQFKLYRPEIQCLFSMNYRNGVYHTQDTSRMGTARVEQEEEADIGRKERGTKRKCPKKYLTSTDNLTMMFPSGRDSPYHKSN